MEIIKIIKDSPNEYYYTVPEGFCGTVSRFLKQYHSYSERLLTLLKRNGKLLRNGESIWFVEQCEGGDEIVVKLPFEDSDYEGVDMALDVIAEDNDVIIINKPAGIVVHPTSSYQEATLAHIIQNHWSQTGFVGKIRFVNRIDMFTSGIVVGAKNKFAHHYIQSQFKSRTTMKIYYAIVAGKPPEVSGEIDAPIDRERPDSIVRTVVEGAKESKTFYEVLGSSNDHTLLKLRLESGRTHQIRVHLKHIGCPIIEDDLYNPGTGTYIGRLALHSAFVGFDHPRSESPVSYIAPLPDDFVNALIRLGIEVPVL
jgi:23S rRNA pseudouridine1911/1915/1917 synthase